MSTPSLPLAAARRVADAALQCSSELGAPVAVTVVDAGGNPLVVLRADGATFLATTLATQKAATAAGVGAPTGALAEQVAQYPALLAGLSSRADMALIPGGLPLLVDGALVGGVGVSGGPAGEDLPIAEAAAAALAPAPVAG